MTILFLEKVGTAAMGAIILFSVFLFLFYTIFGLLSYWFKLVVMTDKKLLIIMPFRLQFKSLSYDTIDNFYWDLWEIRGGSYRKLTIRTASGYRINISDLEFINYDRLEMWLLDKTNLNLTLERKYNIELRQAKSNRWRNLVVILLLVFFLIVLSTDDVKGNIDLAIRISILVITCRLVLKLVHYQQRINKDNNKGVRLE